MFGVCNVRERVLFLKLVIRFLFVYIPAEIIPDAMSIEYQMK